MRLTPLFAVANAADAPFPQNFLFFSLLAVNLAGETGSTWTASATTQSLTTRDFPRVSPTASRYNIEMDHPRMKGINSAVHYNRQREANRMAPPMLGEHNDQILREAGFSAGEIKVLRERGARSIPS